MKLTPVAVVVPLLLLLLTALLTGGLNLNSARYDRELQALDDFSRFERGLNGMLGTRLAASDHGSSVAAATRLSAAMLRLTLDTSEAAADEVQDRLSELAALQPPPGDVELIQGALAHGGLLHDLLPKTDAVLKALIAAASSPEEDVVRSLIVKRQLATRASARQYRLILYATSLTLLGVLVYFGLQLRARAIALQRRAAFEHVIAQISTRFINAQRHEIFAHVERALGELAECIGADRAYFVMAAEPLQVHQWCRRGATFPKGKRRERPWLTWRAKTARSFARDLRLFVPADRNSNRGRTALDQCDHVSVSLMMWTFGIR